MKGFVKKLITAALAVVMLSATAATFVGCGGKTPNTDQDLEISIADFGYGTRWMESIIEEFKKQEWVKEKYPKLTVTLVKSYVRTFPTDRIMSGSTTIDLVIGEQDRSKFMRQYSEQGVQKNYYAELSDVYNGKVPGEDITVAEKMNATVLEQAQYKKIDGTGTTQLEDGSYISYHEMPTVAGMEGMIYNKTMFDQLGYSVPNTTEELVGLCDTIVKNTEYYPFSFSSKETSYWTNNNWTLWWAQYEGLKEFANYFRGIKGDELSKDVLKQTGRLRSLEAMHELIGYKDGKMSANVHPNVNTMPFMQAQAKLLTREALMMPNGSWFITEMEETEDDEGFYDDDIVFMKMPVISSIVEKLEYRNNGSYMTDEMLSEIIDAVDEGETSFEGVSDKDFVRILEARKSTKNYVQYATIPDYAVAKEAAKDILRFMATDIANIAVAKERLCLAFNSDLSTLAPSVYEELPEMTKQVRDAYNNDIFIAEYSSHPIMYIGGFTYLHGNVARVEKLYTSQNSADRKTPQQIYQADIDFWTDMRWNSVLTNCGLL